MKRLFLAAVILFIAAASCTPKASPVTTTVSVTLPPANTALYGFFPSPPEASTQSVIDTYHAIGEHGNAALLQQNIPWAEFAAGDGTDSAVIKDLHNQYLLAGQNKLEVIFVVDPLNGLNRREFFGLPEGWQSSFANPQVRAAFTNYTMRIVHEFHPRYLGLASEINTYADTSPEDFPNFLSLYNTVYDLVKAEAPETKIFVTFQWEEMNNLIPGVGQGKPYEVNWEMIKQFEPRLDLWAISSYPWAVGLHGADIPVTYYASLLAQTQKPLAVAEGGYITESIGAFTGTPQDQVDYLNAIHSQIGGQRLAFWIYLILTELNMDSYAEIMNQTGHGKDAATLGYFATVGLRRPDGTPKPALAIWDSFRHNKSLK